MALEKLVVGQFRWHGKGAESVLFLLAFQQGDFIHRFGGPCVVHTSDDLMT